MPDAVRVTHYYLGIYGEPAATYHTTMPKPRTRSSTWLPNRKAELGSKQNPYATRADANKGHKKYTRWYGSKNDPQRLIPSERTKSKRPMGPFFTKMVAAKRRGDTSFQYKGKTYSRAYKGHLVYYTSGRKSKRKSKRMSGGGRSRSRSRSRSRTKLKKKSKKKCGCYH